MGEINRWLDGVLKRLLLIQPETLVASGKASGCSWTLALR